MSASKQFIANALLARESPKIAYGVFGTSVICLWLERVRFSIISDVFLVRILSLVQTNFILKCSLNVRHSRTNRNFVMICKESVIKYLYYHNIDTHKHYPDYPDCESHICICHRLGMAQPMAIAHVSSVLAAQKPIAQTEIGRMWLLQPV